MKIKNYRGLYLSLGIIVFSVFLGFFIRWLSGANPFVRNYETAITFSISFVAGVIISAASGLPLFMVDNN